MSKSNPAITLGSLAQLTVRAFGIISGAFVMILLSRTLTVSEFGHFTILLALIGLITAGTELGLANTFVWKYQSSERSSLLSAFFVWRTILGALGFLVGLCISAFLMGPTLPIDSSALILVTLLFSGLTSLQTLFVAKKQVGIQNLLLFSQSAIWLIFVLVLSNLGSGLTGFAVGFLISGILQAVLTLSASRWNLVIRKARLKEHLLSLMKLTSFLGITSLLVAIYYRVPSLAVYAILGPDASAMFNISQRLLDIVQVIPAAVLITYLPNLSAYFVAGNTKLINEEWRKNFGLLLPLSIFVSTFISSSSTSIVSILFGDEYLGASLAIQILIWNFPLVVLGWLLSPIMIASARSKTLAAVAALAVTINFPVTIALTNLFGITGACIASLITELFVVAGLWVSAFPGKKVKFELLVLLKGSIAALGSGLINLFTRFHEIVFIDLSIKVILGSGLWALSAFCLNLWKVARDESLRACQCEYSATPLPHYKEKNNCREYIKEFPHIRLENAEGSNLEIFPEFLKHYANSAAHLIVVSYKNGIFVHRGSTYIGVNPIHSIIRMKNYLGVVTLKTIKSDSAENCAVETQIQNQTSILIRSFRLSFNFLLASTKLAGLIIKKSLTRRKKVIPEPWKIRVREVKCDSTEGHTDSFIVSDGATLADPFYFEIEDRQLVVAEKLEMPNGKGKIVLFEKIDRSWSELGTVLEGNHHISFPFVFHYDGEIFMCPEESALENIRLLEIGSNPLKVVEKSSILKIRAVDCVIFFKDGLWWLLCTTKAEKTRGYHNYLDAFYSDNPLSADWKPHTKNPIVLDSRKARNGGLFHKDGSTYRVAQEQGFGEYGRSFGVYEILKINPSEYIEQATSEFEQLKESWGYTHHLHFSNNVFVQDFKE